MAAASSFLTGSCPPEDNATVPKFRIDTLAELARQMQFTPHDVRGVQLAAAEELLHSLDALKAYPLEFVVYRVTGYRPKVQVEQDLLRASPSSTTWGCSSSR